MKIVIPLIGYARSGKDTFANYAIETYNCKKQKFAKPLYDMLVAMYENRYSYEEFEEMKSKDQSLPGFPNVTVRKFLQLLGTEFGRDMIDKNLWTNLLINKVENYPEGTITIISDCRFENELSSLVKNDKFRVCPIYLHRKDSKPQVHHASEKDISDLSKLSMMYWIENNGEILDLHEKADEFFLFLSQTQ